MLFVAVVRQTIDRFATKVMLVLGSMMGFLMRKQSYSEFETIDRYTSISSILTKGFEKLVQHLVLLRNLIYDYENYAVRILALNG